MDLFASTIIMTIGSVFPHNVSLCLDKIEVYDTLVYPESLDHLRTTPDDPDIIRILLSLSSSKTSYKGIFYEFLASAITVAYAEFCLQDEFGNKMFQ